MGSLEYTEQLEQTVQTLTDKLEVSEKGRTGALALINVMRAKYKLMKDTSDDYEYWGRVAEYDSLMKYNNQPNTGPLGPDLQRIYKDVRERADKGIWQDVLTQDIENDILVFLQVMRQEIDEASRRR